MEIFTIIVTGFLGAVMGSFAGAQVWRLRAAQLRQDKAAGEKVNSKEYQKLNKLGTKGLSKDRSCCLNCHKELKWFDMIPILSWLRTGGKCRYCKEKIGWTELAPEFSLAALFMVSLGFWPEPLIGIELVKLVVWLAALALLAVLFVYDLRWSLLPDVVNWPFIALGAVYAGLSAMAVSHLTDWLWSLLGGVFVLSGIYLLLYIVSRGGWIGFGDVKLGLGLALFLADWRLSFLALFAANLIGTLIVLPAMIKGKVQKNTKVPFGPLLIIGFLLAWFFGYMIINNYFILL